MSEYKIPSWIKNPEEINSGYAKIDYSGKESKVFSDAKIKYSWDKRGSWSHNLSHFLAPYLGQTYSDVENKWEEGATNAGWEAFNKAQEEGYYKTPRMIYEAAGNDSMTRDQLLMVMNREIFKDEGKEILNGFLTEHTLPFLPSAELLYDKDSVQNWYKLQDQIKDSAGGKIPLTKDLYSQDYAELGGREDGTEFELNTYRHATMRTGELQEKANEYYKWWRENQFAEEQKKWKEKHNKPMSKEDTEALRKRIDKVAMDGYERYLAEWGDNPRGWYTEENESDSSSEE